MSSTSPESSPRDEFKFQDAASYDTVADDFERFTDVVTVPIARRMLADLPIAANSRVLDLGCGTGVLCRELGPRLRPDGRIVGVDLSEGMLRTAARLSSAAGATDVVEFRRGDAEALPFDKGEFDAVVSLYALRHFPHPDRALAEVFRVCRPGASVVIAIGSGPAPLSRDFFVNGLRVAFETMQHVVGRGPLHATAFLDAMLDQELPRPSAAEEAEWTHGPVHLSGTVAAMMQAAGFRDVRTSWIGQSTVLRSVDDFWDLQVTFSSRARKRIAAAAPDGVKRLRERFEREVSAHVGRGGTLVYRSGALVTRGVRPD